eukprot:c4367_g1_i1.p2 GENE.c4367_g1_i1~~c4367_g1_i1.p2  ORF type:complete len:198 (+),score=44.88 c4367_g1_i1:206-799(+)
MAEIVFTNVRKVLGLLESCRVLLASSQVLSEVEAVVKAMVAANVALLQSVVAGLVPTVNSAYTKQQVMECVQQIMVGLQGLVQSGSAYTVVRLDGRDPQAAKQAGAAFRSDHKKAVELVAALAILTADAAGCEMPGDIDVLLGGEAAAAEPARVEPVDASGDGLDGLYDNGLYDEGMEDASASSDGERDDRAPLLRR